MQFFVTVNRSWHFVQKGQSNWRANPVIGKFVYTGIFLLNLILAEVAYAGSTEHSYRVQEFDIDIPQLNAADALNTLAEQTDAILLFPYRDAISRQANSVKGRYTLMDALAILLQGSGLTGGLSEDSAIKISIGGDMHRNKKIEERESMKKHHVFTGLFAALASFVGAHPSATGQESTAPSVTGLEEIVVTAQKRTESLQDVPVSVSAFSAAAIQASNISRIEEITTLAPTVTFDTKRDFGTSSLRVRGVGTLVLDSGVESSVATVIDGIVMSQGGAALNEFPDVERVEVLNGPQGTLFGKNASAGLLNVVTRRPNTGEFEGVVDFRLAGDQDYKLSGAISAPLNDEMAYRLSGYWRGYDGNVQNVLTGNHINGIDAYGIRGKLLWNPSDKVEVLLSADYTDQDTECCQRILRRDTGDLTYDSSLLPTMGTHAYGGPLLTGSIADITGLTINAENHQVATEIEPSNTAENYGLGLEINWEMGEHRLTSITGLRRFETVGTRDNDETPLPLNNFQRAAKESSWFSQELRLASPVGGTYDYMVGLYYYTADNENLDQFERIISVSLDGRFDVASTPQTDHFVQSGFARGDIETTNMAIFGNLNYHPGEDLTLFAGFRFLRDEIDGTVSGTRIDINPAVGTLDDNNAGLGLIGVGPLSSGASDTDVIGRTGIQYRFAEDSMLYATYSTGFKGRGYSTEFFASAARFGAEPVEPETSKSMELGLKSTFMDNRARFNATLFRTRIDGFQLTFRDLVTLVNSLNSVEEIVTEGAEIDFSWAATENLVFNAGLAFVDAVFASYANSNNGDLSGTTLPNAPEFKGVFSARYEDAISSNLSGYVQLNYRYQDEVNYLQDGSGFEQFAGQDSFGIADLSFGIDTLDGKYSASLFVKNLTDEFYVTGISPNGNAGGGFVLHALPRDYSRYLGAALKINF